MTALDSDPLRARDRLILALDVPGVETARSIATELAGEIGVFKIGLELAHVGGADFARELARQGGCVFLDLKLHDIPNTVERAVAQIAESGVRFLTVHGYPQTMAAAARGARGSGLALLAVTALTSFTDADLAEAGYGLGLRDLVARRAMQARDAGLAGLVMSAQEVEEVRRLVGAEMILVTPGIRPSGAAAADQKRVATPAEAIRAGSDYLVVGRPVLQAPDRRAAARAILAEMADAFAGRS